jgi:hypothetical protein
MMVLFLKIGDHGSAISYVIEDMKRGLAYGDSVEADD